MTYFYRKIYNFFVRNLDYIHIQFLKFTCGVYTIPSDTLYIFGRVVKTEERLASFPVIVDNVGIFVQLLM